MILATRLSKSNSGSKVSSAVLPRRKRGKKPGNAKYNVVLERIKELNKGTKKERKKDGKKRRKNSYSGEVAAAGRKLQNTISS